MGSIVILGHGGFDQASTEFPPEVLVPTGTTLRFFSDAGQALSVPALAGDSDYGKMVDVWAHFREDQQPIPAGWVTYNYELGPDDTQTEYDLGRSLDWGAEVVSVPPGGADLRLCDGTADTCPTPALRVQQARSEAGTGAAVPAERWEHHCTGILGRHAGNDLVWIACTGFTQETPELGALDTAPSAGPGFDRTPWVPDDTQWYRVNEANKRIIKEADDGATVPIAVGGVLLLVGSDHGFRESDYVRRQADLEQGQLTVTKGSTFSRGTLAITGIGAKQSVVEAALEQISDKAITFG